MRRVHNTEEFIARAIQIHGRVYDYSKVKYVKTSKKVIIVCPVHGEFEQTPQKHLSGQGCPICGRERTRLGKDEFIRQARLIHGDKYDYSKVVYQSTSKPVVIICPIHGEFLQTPKCHIGLRQNCPKCGHKAAGKKRRGVHNVAHRKDVKEKKRKTFLERYGAVTWSASKEGRRKQRALVLETDMLDRMKQTCQSRYGHDFWTQSKDGRNKLSEIMNKDSMKQKIKNGYEKKYGCHYMQTEEGRAKAQKYIDTSRRQKMKETMLRKYGCTNYFAADDFAEKAKKALLLKYGVTHIAKSKYFQQKAWQTKHQNGTFNTSKPEETLYLLLCDVFGKNNVFRQYFDEKRYPFHCDFYVLSEDLFIELNAHWSHGGHFYTKTSVEDNEKLACWRKKAAEKGSRYYHSAIETWTKRDLEKRDIALQNKINYVVFWSHDLSDAKNYLSNYSRP